MRFELPKLQFRFKDREWAGKVLHGVLNDVLKKTKLDVVESDVLLLGIPRGGVIVAGAIADKMRDNCKFNIVLPRKLRAQYNEEVSIGAIMEDGTTYINTQIYDTLEISNSYLENEKSYQLEEIKRRKTSYTDVINLPKTELNGEQVENKIIIIIDDGAATGSTIIVTARWIRKLDPKLLVILIPVAPKETVEILKNEADFAESFITPRLNKFRSVGQYYQNFDPVSDEAVRAVLKRRIR